VKKLFSCLLVLAVFFSLAFITFPCYAIDLKDALNSVIIGENKETLEIHHPFDLIDVTEPWSHGDFNTPSQPKYGDTFIGEESGAEYIFVLPDPESVEQTAFWGDNLIGVWKKVNS
jgi:hypothetical protein